jgi:hypothetical protein
MRAVDIRPYKDLRVHGQNSPRLWFSKERDFSTVSFFVGADIIRPRSLKIFMHIVKTTRKTGGLPLAISPWCLQASQDAAFTVFKLPCIILLFAPKGALWF